MTPPIRVLIADDSEVIRSALTTLLTQEQRLEVVGAAHDGLEAVRLAKALRPDVITMDVLMPELDGLDAIAQIMAEAPSRILVVSSAADDAAMNLSLHAIARGALEVIAKPSGGMSLLEWGRRLAESVRLMAEVPVVRRGRASSPPGNEEQARDFGRINCFGIVASTGGPPALFKLLGALPAELPIPIFAAQHIAHGFTRSLVTWLREATKLDVRVAKEGELARAACVYLPPDGTDFELDAEGVIRISENRGGCCPNGDRLLASLAAAYGPRAAAAVLTGMGEDGARGLLAVRRRGGFAVAQDERSSVVFGMPRAAHELGAASELLPVETIAARVARAARYQPLLPGQAGRGVR